MGRSAPADPHSAPSSSQALPRAHIIRHRGIFNAARQRGHRWSNRWMTLNLLPQDPVQPVLASVAFLTPKRIGSAVARNRIRRRMREIYRRHLLSGGATPYLIWIARPPILELDFEGLKRCMTELRDRTTKIRGL